MIRRHTALYSAAFVAVFVALLLLSVLTLGTASASAAESRLNHTKLSLVAFSTPREAYAKLIPAFQASPAGQGVTFDQSFAASETRSQGVINGLPADVVHLSLEPHVPQLVEAGLVDPGWKQNE
jgi:ABC-type sulfate transport system substrate-binding protein